MEDMSSHAYISIKKRIESVFANLRTFRVRRVYFMEITEEEVPFKITARIGYEELCRFTTIHKYLI